MNVKKNLTKINRTKVRGRRNIKYLVIHYYGALGTAYGNTIYFKDVNRDSSAHYFVDEKPDVWQVVEDNDIAWHSGGPGNGAYKGIATNANSLSIEMRPDKINKKSMKASDKDWYFHPKTVDNTIKLAVQLMKKYNIPMTHVIRHYDVTNKYCPRPFMGADINAHYGKTGNAMWYDFRLKLQNALLYKPQPKPPIKEEKKVTQEEFNKMMDVYLKERNKQEPAPWSKDDRNWAEKNGIIKGDEKGKMNYKGFVTREEAVSFLRRTKSLK